MDGLSVFPIIYILECENGMYYIGITYNLNLRLAQHFSGLGSVITKTHKPISVYKIIYKGDELIETLNMMREFGYERVRGSYWSKLEIKNNPLLDEKYLKLIG